MIQALVGQMTQAANAARELQGIRAECRNVCELVPVSSQYDATGHRSRMSVRIGCLGVQRGIRFAATVAIKDLSCLGVDVSFGGDILGEEGDQGGVDKLRHRRMGSGRRVRRAVRRAGLGAVAFVVYVTLDIVIFRNGPNK